MKSRKIQLGDDWVDKLANRTARLRLSSAEGATVLGLQRGWRILLYVNYLLPVGWTYQTENRLSRLGEVARMSGQSFRKFGVLLVYPV